MPELAAVYARLSYAQFGDATKVGDQIRISRALAGNRGWAVPDSLVFCDNNKSAWQRDRKRKDWDRMTAMVRAGQIRRIVNYHGDRLIRQPRDLETLIEFAENLGVVIISPTGEYQLDVGHDRFILRILAAKACLESDDISRRKKDGFARMAAEGIAPPAGSRYGRGFGYDAAGRVPVPEEADALREACDRVLAGDGLIEIAADLTARGVRAVSGGPVTYRMLREVLLRPRTAGLLRDGSAGSWTPILSPERQALAGALLRSRFPARARGHSRNVHLLSGIAECWSCGKGLQRQTTAPRGGKTIPKYGCVTRGCGKAVRDMAMLDAYVTARVVARLSHPGNPAASQLPASSAAEIPALLAQQAETEAAIADPARAARLGPLLARLDAITARLAGLRERTDADHLARLRSSRAGISAGEFASLPLNDRRALVAACFRVVVLPASAKGPGFRTEDVRLLARE